MQEYVVRLPGDLLTLRKRLDRPEPLLRQMGAMLVSDAKASFDRQALGSIKWPERYPGQREPKLNVAGAVADFAKGRTSPLPRRFQDRPAGIDTSETRRSIAFDVKGDGVEVGSVAPQAGTLQKGGVTTQALTPTVKKAMAKFLRPTRTRASWAGPEATDEQIRAWARTQGMVYKPSKRRSKDGSLAFSVPSPYRDKLGPLFNLSELKTKVHARPFVGVTDEMREDLLRAAEEFFATGRTA